VRSRRCDMYVVISAFASSAWSRTSPVGFDGEPRPKMTGPFRDAELAATRRASIRTP
jgi:hypothetical protein